MSFKLLMIIKAIVCLSLGAIILVVPEFLYSIFGTTLSAGGVFAAREYGASLFGNMLVTWFARNAPASAARKAIILGLFVYDAIGFIVTLIAVIAGVLNPLGWLVVALYLFFTVGFGYYYLKPPKP
jgi:hypothetical protein